MPAGNEIVEDAHPMSLSAPVTLVYFDGATLATRAVIAELPQTDAQLDTARSISGRNAWLATPPRFKQIAFIDLPAERGAGTERYRVMDRERVNIVDRTVKRDTTRLMIRRKPEA